MNCYSFQSLGKTLYLQALYIEKNTLRVLKDYRETLHDSSLFITRDAESMYILRQSIETRILQPWFFFSINQ